jgi:hypothetical protein
MSAQKPDLAWMRRAVERARLRDGYIAGLVGSVDDVAEQFHITPYQACELMLCKRPRSFYEAQVVALRCCALWEDVFSAFVAEER